MGKKRPGFKNRLLLVSFAVFLFSLFVVVGRLQFASSYLPHPVPYMKESRLIVVATKNRHGDDDQACTRADYVPNSNTICCDRNSSSKYDICFMRGDIRTRPLSPSIFLYNSSVGTVVEKIRPYPRKWETGVMTGVQQVSLIATGAAAGSHTCDVYHSVPAVVFYAGGYTGNLYHDFNDGIVPLYVTTQHFNKRVVIVVLKYRTWWLSKYHDILSQLSNQPPVDFSGDRRTHCFPSAVVGVRVHDGLSIDPSKTAGNKTILDFRRLLDDAYRRRVQPGLPTFKKPRLVIMSRNGSRGVENEADVVSLGRKVGFQVQVLRPKPTTDLAQMYGVLNSTDVMVGVHGAALTQFLFLRPGSVLVQIVPLGNAWVAEACFGLAARRMGLRYMEYRISAEESSLYREYGEDSPVVREAERKGKGWKVTKEVYLNGQSVRLDLRRFRRWLEEAYSYALRRTQPSRADFGGESS